MILESSKNILFSIVSSSWLIIDLSEVTSCSETVLLSQLQQNMMLEAS